MVSSQGAWLAARAIRDDDAHLEPREVVKNMPYPRKVTPQQRALLRDVALTRRQVADVYKTLPTNKQLARDMGVSRGAIEQILQQELAANDAAVEAGVEKASDASTESILDSRITNASAS